MRTEYEMNSTTSSICDDDYGTGNDSIAALEALLTIKRSSIDFSDSVSTKQQIREQAKDFFDSTPIMTNKKEKREFYLSSSTSDQSAVNPSAAPLHLAAAAPARKGKNTKTLPITNVHCLDTHSQILDTNSAMALSINKNTPAKSTSQNKRTKKVVPSMPEKSSEVDTYVFDYDGESNSVDNNVIHSDKINAALKSKPQRGKKRDNLNAFERLELTRTRNREHAKSTRSAYFTFNGYHFVSINVFSEKSLCITIIRLRKKARYEELMDREVMYFEHQREKERDEARRRHLVLFMDLRSKLFLRQELCSSSSIQGKDDRKLSSSSRIVSSVNLLPESQFSPPPSVALSKTMFPNSFLFFEDILDNVQQFKFDYVARDANHAYHGLEAVEWIDRTITNRFQSTSLNYIDMSFPRYRIIGGSQGIGINQQGSAYAEFDVVCSHRPNGTNDTMQSTPTRGRNSTEDHIFLSGMLQAEFSNTTDKIVSIKVFSITEKSSSTNGEVEANTLHNGFPSVVSMDNHQGGFSLLHGMESAQNDTHADDSPKHESEIASGGDGEYLMI